MSIQAIVISALLTAIGCSGAKLPYQAEKALRDSPTFELLSLNPTPTEEATDDELFHGYIVRGRATVPDATTRSQLLTALKQGIAENDGSVARCFNPRHGISVVLDGKKNDFVICFECSSINWYIGGERSQTIFTTGSPQSVFDDVLKKAGVPLSSKDISAK